MKFAGLIFATTMVLGPLSAQIHVPSAPSSAVAAKPATGAEGGSTSTVALHAMSLLEKDLDGRMAVTGGADPCVVLGKGSRGIYVSGFGAIFTIDMDLVNSPDIGPFRTSIPPEEKATLHKRKIAHVALLQTALKEALTAMAQSGSLRAMSANDQIVVGVRLMYRPWEDTTGLPGQIVMRADRNGGNVRTELQ